MSLFPLLILWCSLFALLGSLVGGIAGLVPGLHPNTLASVFSTFPIFLLLCSSPIGSDAGPILFGCFLVGLLLSHSMTEIIVTATMGVASDDTIVALLPSQRLHAMGRGDLVIECTLIGGLGAVILFTVIMLPIRIVLGSPIGLYSLIKPMLGLILIAICTIVLFSGRNLMTIICSFQIFFCAGILGMLVLTLQIPSALSHQIFGQIWSAESSDFLLPAFTGFFAIPGIILPRISTMRMNLDRAPVEEIRIGRIKPLLRSLIPATLVGWLPGITNAYATSLIMMWKKEKSQGIVSSCAYIITYSATNIGGSLSSIIALATISRSRNGILQAIDEHFPFGQLLWSDIAHPQISILAFLWAGCIGAIVGAYLCKRFGSRILKIPSLAQKRILRFSLIVFIFSLVLLISGPVGTLLLLTCFALAIWAVRNRVSRIHLMGFMLIPAIAYFLSN